MSWLSRIIDEIFEAHSIFSTKLLLFFVCVLRCKRPLQSTLLVAINRHIVSGNPKKDNDELKCLVFLSTVSNSSKWQWYMHGEDMGNAPLFPFSSFLLGLPPIFKSHTIKPCTVKNNSLSDEYVTLFHDKARTCVTMTTVVSYQIESVSLK